MKILFVVGSFPQLSETFIMNQITGLLGRGHDVSIYAFSPAPDEVVHRDVLTYRLLERTTYATSFPANWGLRLFKAVFLFFKNISPRNAPVLMRSLNGFRFGGLAISLRLFYATLPLLEAPPYEIIHCHFGDNGMKVQALRDVGVLKGKLLTTFHGEDVNKKRTRRRRMLRDLFRSGERFTTNTSFTAERVVSLGCPRDRISQLPVGVDLEKFRSVGTPTSRGDKKTVLAIGRLVEKKGHEYAIRAVEIVLRNTGIFVYRIVGEGPLRASLEALTKSLSIESYVEFLGGVNQEKVLALMADCDVFVLPSVTASDGDQEGQGLVLQEAQAMEVPVISTLHNGIPEGVQDGETAFLVPEKDPDALAERLTYLLEHPKKRKEMGRAGRRFVEKHYDIEKLNDRLVDIYSDLLGTT